MAGHNVPAIFVFAHFVIPGSLAVLAPRNDRIGFQTAKRHRPYSLRRRVRRLPLPSPSTNAEGMERRKAHPFNSRLAACASLAKDARPAALHRGDFCPRDHASAGGRAGIPRSRSGQLSPPFIRAASSHQRQPLIVGTDSDPRPPGSGVTSPARRRRTWLHLQDVPRRHPQPSQASWNIILSKSKSRGGGERCQTMRTDQDARRRSRFLGLRALCVL